MILTFSKSKFEDLIKEGIKQHTIRTDRTNRWKVGNSIQFWMGNPRNTRGKVKPYQFGTGVVSRVETIRMEFSIGEDWQEDVVYIGDDIKLKTPDELNALAINDGFENWEEMKLWFDIYSQFTGKIIFWNNFKYNIKDNLSF